uniref:Sulfite oxidase n=1 Tax=Hydrogenophilus thermoluteolus TaxID=297 RepID=Q08IS3_HYDTE|nr:sulfite oxidase [Hydrogenophilus thermoluteolus]
MSKFSKTLIAVATAVVCSAAVAARYEGIGSAATPAEVKAWDIDVRPDFVGLPPGRGTPEEGEAIWLQKCAMCHGDFAESNEVFTPIIGGTTQEDIQTGRVKALVTGSVPQRTTIMKVPTVSTLWDYIHRAMPWTSPKSLTNDEVYALVAYLLNLAEIIPYDFELNQETIKEVQNRMPNRNGMTWDHGMWPWGPGVKAGGIGNGGKPDVQGSDCMKNCKKEVVIASNLPEYAWDAHGNLKEQNRVIGPVRGKEISEAAKAEAQTATGKQQSMLELAKLKGCTACHGIDKKIVGPAYKDVATKYAGKPDAVDYLAQKIKNGGAGVWGNVPMPPHPALSEEELRSLAQWIVNGAAVE